MSKTRIYILQALGIILLLIGYLVNDRPDHESLMHFDHTSTHVISGVKLGGNNKAKVARVTSESKGHHHKHRSVKVYSTGIILPKPIPLFCFNQPLATSHNTPFSEGYIFLYFKEINPPPPKVC